MDAAVVDAAVVDAARLVDVALVIAEIMEGMGTIKRLRIISAGRNGIETRLLRIRTRIVMETWGTA